MLNEKHLVARAGFDAVDDVLAGVTADPTALVARVEQVAALLER